MVQVPIGGVLKVIDMFPSTGECNVVILESAVIGGGNCPTPKVACNTRRRFKRIEDVEAWGIFCFTS